MGKVATAVEHGGNRKIGEASITHVSQASCDPSCPFMGKGCMAEQDLMQFTTRRLNGAVRRETPAEFARAEAKAIDGLSGNRPLRLHGVGDARTPKAASILADAAERHTAKSGKAVWTYTHAWRKVGRAAWKAISVLASTETLSDAISAMDRGYAAALVVAKHESDKATIDPETGVRMIPCPSQTRKGLTCSDCKLCFNDSALRDRRAIIVFEAHGGGASKVREALANFGTEA